MSSTAGTLEIDWERFRSQLLVLAEIHMGRELRGKFEPSDIVQQTMLEAHRSRSSFRGQTDAELAAWLRTILAHNILCARRSLGRAKRDVGREQSLQAELDLSSQRLDAWLVADQSSPSAQVQRRENSTALAQALLCLPAGQREALLLRYFKGWSFAEIGRHMECTTSTVAGLLARGSKQLRDLLHGHGNLTPTEKRHD